MLWFIYFFFLVPQYSNFPSTFVKNIKNSPLNSLCTFPRAQLTIFTFIHFRALFFSSIVIWTYPFSNIMPFRYPSICCKWQYFLTFYDWVALYMCVLWHIYVCICVYNVCVYGIYTKHIYNMYATSSLSTHPSMNI